MITDYSSEIKIAIFKSIWECQRANWATIVTFRPSCSTIFTFYPYLTQKRFKAISVAINAHIHKVMAKKQKVKMVNVYVCKKPPKLIAYHSNVPWIITKLM